MGVLIIKSSRIIVFMFCLIILFLIFTNHDNIKPIAKQLRKEYKEYFVLKDNNSKEYVYNNYNKLTKEEMIAFNMIDEYKYKPLINLNSTQAYVHEYFKFTNKNYDESLTEDVINKSNALINKYKYYVTFIKFIKYSLIIVLIEVVYELILIFKRKSSII